MLLRLRQDFWGQSQKSRTNYIYDVFSICGQCDDVKKRIQYHFRINGNSVCCKVWYEMHGIPKTSFYRYKEKFESGVREYVHGNTCILRRSLAHTSLERALVKEFMDKNSIRMPQKSRTIANGVIGRSSNLQTSGNFK